jgi:hypothetical protein
MPHAGAYMMQGDNGYVCALVASSCLSEGASPHVVVREETAGNEVGRERLAEARVLHETIFPEYGSACARASLRAARVSLNVCQCACVCERTCGLILCAFVIWRASKPIPSLRNKRGASNRETARASTFVSQRQARDWGRVRRASTWVMVPNLRSDMP